MNYLYDGAGLSANVIEAVDNSGNILARYTQGPGTDLPLAQLRSSTTSYYEQDGLGSVSSLSNSSATIANTYTYDAYGRLTTSTGAITNSFQYTGRETDPETSLDYYRLRYYDPTSGRFLSEDLITFDGGIDFYEYVRNHPLNFVDPFGLASKQGPRPSPVPNPIPNSIARDHAAYEDCIADKYKSKNCLKDTQRFTKEQSQREEGEDIAKDAVDSLLDAFSDCLCEHPLAVYYPGFNDIKPGQACGSLPWWLDWWNKM